MPRKKEPLKVPVKLDGSGIYHSIDYIRGAESRAEADRINSALTGDGRIYGRVNYVMETVEPFEVQLRVREFDAGDHYVTMADEFGRWWPMFLTDYFDLVTSRDTRNGCLPKLRYETCKKGARQYGIRPVTG